MSAYVVDHAHIDALVRLSLDGPADRGPSYPGDGWNGDGWYWQGRWYHSRELGADALGQMLMDECVRSVSARYPDDAPGEQPGPRPPYWLEPFRFDPQVKHPTAIEGLKLLDCYNYQSCETDDWRETQAYAFCLYLKDSLIGELAGYDAAPWGWPE